MLFVFSALHAEAQPLIREMILKRREGSGRFQQFIDEKEMLLLTLTGVGEIPAAAGVAAVLSRESRRRGDILLSLGSCAWIGEREAAPELGQYLRLCSIRNRDSGRIFYPDLLERSVFPEARCFSGSRLIRTEEERASAALSGCEVYEMEAAGVYEAGNLFLGPERLHFLRLLTDFGESDSLSPERLRELATRNADVLLTEVDRLLHLSESLSEETALFTNEEKCCTERLVQDLRLSRTLEWQLRQRLCYLQLVSAPWQELTERWYEEGRLPCRDKRQGQKLLEELWKHFHTSI